MNRFETLQYPNLDLSVSPRNVIATPHCVWYTVSAFPWNTQFSKIGRNTLIQEFNSRLSLPFKSGIWKLYLKRWLVCWEFSISVLAKRNVSFENGNCTTSKCLNREASRFLNCEILAARVYVGKTHMLKGSYLFVGYSWLEICERIGALLWIWVHKTHDHQVHLLQF